MVRYKSNKEKVGQDKGLWENKRVSTDRLSSQMEVLKKLKGNWYIQ